LIEGKTLMENIMDIKKTFGATLPPQNGGNLPTKNSVTGRSNRYCIHYISCTYYQQSKKSGNTIGLETSSIEELKTYLKGLPKLEGEIQFCGRCLKEMQK
jgi:hypothetical protein